MASHCFGGTFKLARLFETTIEEIFSDQE